uniref:Uncharacterized protein n=1 Tax=Amphora coffeiformis TaxID=265554 RepID=A0A7S3P7U3_9STRA
MMMEDSMDIDEAHHRNIRRVRKAPSPPGSEIFAVVPDPKRQMVTASPSSTIMEASALQSAPIPSPDDVLVHMIQQSGAKTSAEVVEFCLATGIPLSRCFKLDLMRQLQQNNGR